MILSVLAFALTLSEAAQEETSFRKIGSFHSDRAESDRIFALLLPEGQAPPELKDSVLFLRNRTLEGWSLPTLEKAWETELDSVRLEFPGAHRSEFQGRLLCVSESRNRSLVDLKSRRRVEPPIPHGRPEALQDGRLLFSSWAAEGYRFKLDGTGWEWVFPNAEGNSSTSRDDRRIVGFEEGIGESPARLLVREIGSDRPAAEIKLPFPGYPQTVLVGDRAYVTLDRPDARAYLTVDLAAGKILGQEILPLPKEEPKPVNTGGYNPGSGTTRVAVAGLGRLLVAPDGVALEHERRLWERKVQKPQIVHADREVLAIRSEDRVDWVQASTGRPLFGYPLNHKIRQSYGRVGSMVLILGLDAGDAALGLYSLVSGERLAAVPPLKPPSRTFAINWDRFNDQISQDGDRVALDVANLEKKPPGEIRVVNLKSGKRIASLALTERAQQIALRGKYLVVRDSKGVHVYAP